MTSNLSRERAIPMVVVLFLSLLWLEVTFYTVKGYLAVGSFESNPLASSMSEIQLDGSRQHEFSLPSTNRIGFHAKRESLLEDPNVEKAPQLRDSIQHIVTPSSNCSLSAVAYFIFNPEEMSSEKLGANVEQINMMFDAFFDSSLDHCGKLLVLSGAENLMMLENFGLSKKVEVLQVGLPEALKRLHHWNLAWYVQWYYLRYFANTHVIFLDTDTLITYKDLTYFFDNSWDFAIAATPHDSYNTLLNVGVMLVEQNSIMKVEPLFLKIHEEIIVMLGRNVSGILNQRAPLSILSRFGDKKIERVSKIELLKGRYVIKNSCTMVQILEASAKPIRVFILNYYEWNTVPGKVASYSKIIHFRGPRKKVMKEYYLKLRELKQDFISDVKKTGAWCTKQEKVRICKERPYISKGECN